MRPKPTLLRLLLPVLFLLSAVIPSPGSPAIRGQVNLRQPDGTIVPAFLTGDEHGHLVQTADGCSLAQDADGWWCYARYDYYGNRVNTGERAGLPDTPGDVIAASRIIPYDLLFRSRTRRAHKTERLQKRQLARTRALLSEGTGGIRHGLIILAQFPDLPYTFTRDDFERVINGDDPKSALSYFKDQWKDGYTFRFDITDIITLPREFAWYGANDNDGQDKNPAQMVVDACMAVDDLIDFSAYDNDGDGEVDNVFVFFAGPNESEGASENHIWPHMWYVQSGAGITYKPDGVLVDNYACTSELMRDVGRASFTTLASIGTFCHEYTHTFGIPDLYDTDNSGSGDYAEALWNCIDLMDAGNYNDRGFTPPNYSAVERWFFGMSPGRPLEKGIHTLHPVQEYGDYLFFETDTEDELYLFECRNANGWDAHIGGNGLLIYHIDRTERPSGESSSAQRTLSALERWDLNEVNANPDHQCVDLIEPDPEARQHYQNAAKNHNIEAIRLLASHAFWPFGETSLFTSETDPAFRFWSDADSPLGIADIHLNPDGSVTFTVFDDQEEKAPAVKVDDVLVFQDAAIVQWSSVNPSYPGNSFIRYGLADDTNLTEVEITPYETGKYAFVMDGLSPTKAYKFQLLCRNGSIPGPVNSGSFTTKSDRKAGTYPYIYLKNIDRGSDGSVSPGAPLCLRVYNAPDAESVRWYFDGESVSPGPDGYWHIPHSGVLRAVIAYPESMDVIIKEIVVK